MNRREFCFSMGLAVAGSTLAGAAETLRPFCTENRFRAGKIFFRRWYDEFGHESAFRQTEIFRQKLSRLRKEFDSLLVLSSDRVTESFFERLQREADHIGFALFVPAPQGFSIPNDCAAVRFLNVLSNEVIETKTQGNGLLFSVNEEQRLLLFDPSRCRWASFVCGTVPSVSATEDRLATARFLDQKLFS